ncbi:GNAT superfamily N-acetyltransferase [Rhizobium sp. SG_E_25_P2]|uniref:GNAT family N-acetyltransferase n=1 Tax=Rhizobium sp. SG_E_25_P2 TaxID=2879942 RepID=UPI0024747555|nr:GNAT family N-acetyltransferase [Rhizobium sp. SG_E_25_P2]MDH6267597.1 GNAT superfamily N-acetyltransferase [Rhizobium sp. SG_E_25_P2]
MKTLSIELRRADASDARAVAETHRQSWMHAYSGLIPHRALLQMLERRKEDWWRRAAQGPSTLLLLDIGGTIAGYTTIGVNRAPALKQDGEIYELYILPEFQGTGLGSYMFREARAILKGLGMRGLAAWCLEDSEHAVTFFRASGGLDVAEGMEDFGDAALRKLGFIWPN